MAQLARRRAGGVQPIREPQGRSGHSTSVRQDPSRLCGVAARLEAPGRCTASTPLDDGGRGTGRYRRKAEPKHTLPVQAGGEYKLCRRTRKAEWNAPRGDPGFRHRGWAEDARSGSSLAIDEVRITVVICGSESLVRSET